MENFKRRRTSILKKPSEASYSETIPSLPMKKRISFSGKKSVKEFCAGEHVSTIWGTSYEESANSSPSNSERGGFIISKDDSFDLKKQNRPNFHKKLEYQQDLACKDKENLMNFDIENESNSPIPIKSFLVDEDKNKAKPSFYCQPSKIQDILREITPENSNLNQTELGVLYQTELDFLNLKNSEKESIHSEVNVTMSTTECFYEFRNLKNINKSPRKGYNVSVNNSNVMDNFETIMSNSKMNTTEGFVEIENIIEKSKKPDKSIAITNNKFNLNTDKIYNLDISKGHYAQNFKNSGNIILQSENIEIENLFDEMEINFDRSAINSPICQLAEYQTVYYPIIKSAHENIVQNNYPANNVNDIEMDLSQTLEESKTLTNMIISENSTKSKEYTLMKSSSFFDNKTIIQEDCNLKNSSDDMSLENIEQTPEKFEENLDMSRNCKIENKNFVKPKFLDYNFTTESPKMCQMQNNNSSLKLSSKIDLNTDLDNTQTVLKELSCSSDNDDTFTLTELPKNELFPVGGDKIRTNDDLLFKNTLELCPLNIEQSQLNNDSDNFIQKPKELKIIPEDSMRMDIESNENTHELYLNKNTENQIIKEVVDSQNLIFTQQNLDKLKVFKNVHINTPPEPPASKRCNNQKIKNNSMENFEKSLTHSMDLLENRVRRKSILFNSGNDMEQSMLNNLKDRKISALECESIYMDYQANEEAQANNNIKQTRKTLLFTGKSSDLNLTGVEILNDSEDIKVSKNIEQQNKEIIKANVINAEIFVEKSDKVENNQNIANLLRKEKLNQENIEKPILSLQRYQKIPENKMQAPSLHYYDQSMSDFKNSKVPEIEFKSSKRTSTSSMNNDQLERSKEIPSNKFINQIISGETKKICLLQPNDNIDESSQYQLNDNIEKDIRKTILFSDHKALKNVQNNEIEIKCHKRLKPGTIENLSMYDKQTETKQNIEMECSYPNFQIENDLDAKEIISNNFHIFKNSHKKIPEQVSSNKKQKRGTIFFNVDNGQIEETSEHELNWVCKDQSIAKQTRSTLIFKPDVISLEKSTQYGSNENTEMYTQKSILFANTLGKDFEISDMNVSVNTQNAEIHSKDHKIYDEMLTEHEVINENIQTNITQKDILIKKSEKLSKIEKQVKLQKSHEIRNDDQETFSFENLKSLENIPEIISQKPSQNNLSNSQLKADFNNQMELSENEAKRKTLLLTAGNDSIEENKPAKISLNIENNANETITQCHVKANNVHEFTQFQSNKNVSDCDMEISPKVDRSPKERDVNHLMDSFENWKKKRNEEHEVSLSFLNKLIFEQKEKLNQKRNSSINLTQKDNKNIHAISDKVLKENTVINENSILLNMKSNEIILSNQNESDIIKIENCEGDTKISIFSPSKESNRNDKNVSFLSNLPTPKLFPSPLQLPPTITPPKNVSNKSPRKEIILRNSPKISSIGSKSSGTKQQSNNFNNSNASKIRKFLEFDNPVQQDKKNYFQNFNFDSKDDIDKITLQLVDPISSISENKSFSILTLTKSEKTQTTPVEQKIITPNLEDKTHPLVKSSIERRSILAAKRLSVNIGKTCQKCKMKLSLDSTEYSDFKLEFEPVKLVDYAILNKYNNMPKLKDVWLAIESEQAEKLCLNSTTLCLENLQKFSGEYKKQSLDEEFQQLITDMKNPNKTIQIENCFPILNNYEDYIKGKIPSLENNWTLKICSLQTVNFIILSPIKIPTFEIVVECSPKHFENDDLKFHKISSRKCVLYPEKLWSPSDKILQTEISKKMPSDDWLFKKFNKMQNLEDCLEYFNGLIEETIVWFHGYKKILNKNEAVLQYYDDCIAIYKKFRYYDAEGWRRNKEILIKVKDLNSISIRNIILPSIGEFKVSALKAFPVGKQFLEMILVDLLSYLI